MIVKAIKSIENITDAEIDQVCAEYISRNLKSMALKKLGLDEDQVQEIAPIIIDGYFDRDIPGSDEKYSVRYKKSKDNRWRTSNYNAIMFFFSADQVYCYELRFSLLENKKQEKTDEYFYRDIVSVSTESGAVTPAAGSEIEGLGGWTALLPGPLQFLFILRALWGHAKRRAETINFEYFKLTTSGATTISATIFDMESAERSVNGMKSLVRGKKQQQL